MSVESAESELRVAKLAEQVEAAQAALEKKRTPENMEAFDQAVQAFDQARTNHLISYGPPAPAPGDVVVEPEPLAAVARPQ